MLLLSFLNKILVFLGVFPIFLEPPKTPFLSCFRLKIFYFSILLTRIIFCLFYVHQLLISIKISEKSYIDSSLVTAILYFLFENADAFQTLIIITNIFVHRKNLISVLESITKMNEICKVSCKKFDKVIKFFVLWALIWCILNIYASFYYIHRTPSEAVLVVFHNFNLISLKIYMIFEISFITILFYQMKNLNRKIEGILVRKFISKSTKSFNIFEIYYQSFGLMAVFRRINLFLIYLLKSYQIRG